MKTNTLLREYKVQKIRRAIIYLQSEIDDRVLMKAKPCLQANLTREITRLQRQLVEHATR